jgi:hypothetical protein
MNRITGALLATAALIGAADAQIYKGGSGSSGSSTITAGTTATSGFAANTLAGSDGSKIQAYAVPSCSTGLSALIWTTGTGFGCNTFTAAATLGANTFTGIQTLPRGLVGAPVITFGDSTSGFWSGGANKVDLSISGSLNFDCNDTNSGKCTFGVPVSVVGGVSSTTQYTSSSASANLASFYSSGSGSRPILLINSNPNFGVLSTDGAHQFWLGYSGSQAAGTAVITWTDNGAVTIAPNNGQVVLTGLTTGTNADFLCLSAGGVMLIQTSACTISTLRYKPDWSSYAGTAMDVVRQLEVGTFHLDAAFTTQADPNARSLQIGLNAENIARVLPLAAVYENDMVTPKSYRQEGVIALYGRALQETDTRVVHLEAEIAKLKVQR